MSDEAQQIDPLDLEARLSALDSLPVDGHVAIYDALHRELRDQLVGGAGGTNASDGTDLPAGSKQPGPPAAPRASDGPGGAPSPGSEAAGGAPSPGS